MESLRMKIENRKYSHNRYSYYYTKLFGISIIKGKCIRNISLTNGVSSCKESLGISEAKQQNPSVVFFEIFFLPLIFINPNILWTCIWLSFVGFNTLCFFCSYIIAYCLNLILRKNIIEEKDHLTLQKHCSGSNMYAYWEQERLLLNLENNYKKPQSRKRKSTKLRSLNIWVRSSRVLN